MPPLQSFNAGRPAPWERPNRPGGWERCQSESRPYCEFIFGTTQLDLSIRWLKNSTFCIPQAMDYCGFQIAGAPLMTRSLFALLAILFLLPLATPAQTETSKLTVKQLTKAENLVIRLRQFEAMLPADLDSGGRKGRLADAASSARGKLSDLPEGNVKTDLSTALYFFELAANGGSRLDVAIQCASEKPGAYQTLCEDTSGSQRDLISSKARLHMAWAIAGIMEQKSGKYDSGTLDDMEAERRNDRALALRVISALKVLESEVVIHKSLGDFEESNTLARVPFEKFHSDLRKVSAEVETILSWLPQNRVKSALGNALHSYQDGGVRWAGIYRPRVVHVASLMPSEMTLSSSDTAFLATAPYTVAINWRQGSRYLRLAEETLEKTPNTNNSEVARLN